MSAINMTCWRCNGFYIAGMVGSTPWPAHICPDGVNPSEIPCADCGHVRFLHGLGDLLFNANARCMGQVDKRHVTAGGDLSPCDCKRFTATTSNAAQGVAPEASPSLADTAAPEEQR